MTTVTFIFHNYLKEMLNKELGAKSSFSHQFDRRASIKDVIESFGIPHPVVGRLSVNGKETGFAYILQVRDTVVASPLTPPVNPLVPDILRPAPLDRVAFVVDVNVGKLAIYLRVLGFDTLYGNETGDKGLAELAHAEKRILLTRDISLLKRKIIMHGYLPRSLDPARQLTEVVRLYDLGSKMHPLSRCIPCNGLLVPINKNKILDRLEPLTKKYYESFHICERCDRIYWPGSHQEKLVAFIRKVLAEVRRENAQNATP
ncbi:MAG: Mut7-C RNAse domain-containing protein [Desulfobulbales bacterium]|nr:Mut7-C RNAse domain-containing protein [Desulfobulbales bacterium]